MHEQTSVSREKASTLLSELKSLYLAMPLDAQQAVKLIIVSAGAPTTLAQSMGQGT